MLLGHRKSTLSPKAEELGQLPAFRRCTPAQLAKVAAAADEVILEPGTVLCHQGRLGRECYIVTAGRLDVLVDGVPIAVIGPGELVGELSLLDGRPCSATVVARTEVAAFVISRRRFAPLLEDVPAVARGVVAAVADRLRRLDDAVAHPDSG